MGELYDSFRALSAADRLPRGRPSLDESDRLHARIVWSAWVLAEGDEEQLRSRYVLRRNSDDDPLMMRSDEFSAYRQGLRLLSPRRRKQLSLKYPTVAEVFRWPFGLLSSRQWNLKTIEDWNQCYIENPDPVWGRYSFPGDDTSADYNRRPVSLFDLDGLHERGDVYGFFAIACAYRMYHAQRLSDSQWYAAHYLIRALPGICRDARVRPHTREVIFLAKDLLRLLPDTSFRIEVDDDVLWNQIQSPTHEPCREMRLTAAKRGLEIPDPISPIVPYRYKRCLPHQRPLLIAGSG